MRRFMVRVEQTEAFEIPVEVDESMLDPNEVDMGDPEEVLDALKHLAATDAEQQLADASFEEQNKWFIECVDRETTDVTEVRPQPRRR